MALKMSVFLYFLAGSLRSPRPRRQRTTSINQTKSINATESIIRSNNRTIYTAGRPPWYNCAGQQVEPFVIGLLYNEENSMNFFLIEINSIKGFAVEVHPVRLLLLKKLLKV